MVFTERSTTIFDNNESKNKGGVVCAESSDIGPYDNCYPIQFDDHSRVTFTDNKSSKGGAVYLGFTISIKSLQNSTLIFKNNTAHIGGAVFSYAYCITFQGNSHARFSNNVAVQNGGVLFCSSQCNIFFIEYSIVKFSHNEAAQGGVIHMQFNSVIKFQGNSTISFTESKAIENGGVIHSYINSFIEFDDYTTVLFQNNIAKTDGTMNLYSISITSRCKSNVTFRNNNAELGGAIYIASSNMTFTGNSYIQFISNTALQDGGTIYLSDHTNLILTNET